MALDEADLEALVSQAAVILDAAAKPFIAGHRARVGGAQEGQRLRHRGRPGHRTPGRRRAGVGDRHRGARRGVRRRRHRLAAGVGARPDRRHVQLRGRVADGRDSAGPAARRRTGGRADLAAVHRPALHRGRREAAVRQRDCAAAAAERRVGRLHRRHRHLQRRLARALPGPLPARDAGAPEPEMLAGADARRHRHRPGLHRGRNPRRRNQFRPPHLGPRRRRGAGAGGRRHRHRPGRQRLDDRRRARRWPVSPGVHGQILDIVRSVGDPEDY